MTLLDIVNSLMTRMRYSEVGTVEQSTYSKLLREYINDTKREVEDAWPWVQLRQTVQIDTEADTFRYTLSGAGKRYKLMEDWAGRVDVWNDTDDLFLRKAPSMRWMSAKLNDDNPQKDSPSWFDINGQDDSSGDPQVDLYPIPDGAYTINFNMVIPQEDLSDDTDSLTVPSYPVLLGAWARALQDRGEDGATSAINVWQQYHNALADAISIENMNTADSENTWWVV